MPLAPDPYESALKAIGVWVGFALPAVIGAKRLIAVPELAPYADRITVIGIVPMMSILLAVCVFYLGRLAVVWRKYHPGRAG